MCELADAGLESLRGTTLCHMDLRADNVLLRKRDSVVFVDWPWASLGPPWLDTLMLLFNVRLYGGHDVEQLLRQHCDAPPTAVDGVLAGLAGFFTDVARRPGPSGLPTLRAFQAAQPDAALGWLQDRLGFRVRR
jgi:thiamine kinase-like enzyme